MHIQFVTQSAGNRFITEILEMLAEEVASRGVSVSFEVDRFGSDPMPSAYVVVPQEFFGLVDRGSWPDSLQRRRTIAFCTEHPGTQWFEISAATSAGLGACFDINTLSTMELRRRGLLAEHFQLGYVKRWDTWLQAPGVRPIDILYLGTADDRRNQLLASYADVLWPWRARLVIAPQATNPVAGPSYLVGEDRFAALREAKVILNLHRANTSCLEWIRVLEAIHNGCVVVSEHSEDALPLQPGEHFVSSSPTHIGRLATLLLDEPDQLDKIRSAAYGFLRSDLDMAPSIDKLLTTAEELSHGRRRWWPAIFEPRRDDSDGDDLGPGERREFGAIRAGLKRLAVDNVVLRRRLQEVEATLEGANPGSVTEVSSRAHATATPRVSVVIPVFNYEREAIEAVESVLRSDFADYEILVVDDASTDGSAAAMETFIATHQDAPISLLLAASNHGPGWSRNRGSERARGEMVFFLDADNLVYPPTLGRLVAALDEDPGASFAYPMICQRDLDGNAWLFSFVAWDPAQLLESNFVDMFSMVRRSALLAVGGFAEDARLDGMEDYDLWCRLADGGQRGVLVPEILGLYRRTDHSMVSFLNIDTTVALSAVRSRSPRLFANNVPPT